MTFPLSPDDRPDPNEQHAVRARVPEHVARGVFSTGVIVMTAPTEFVIDFIQNLGRPHQVVARVVMPHPVLPQFVDALLKNIELYRARYGSLPNPNVSGMFMTSASGSVPAPNAPPQSQPKSPGQAADWKVFGSSGPSISELAPGDSQAGPQAGSQAAPQAGVQAGLAGPAGGVGLNAAAGQPLGSVQAGEGHTSAWDQAAFGSASPGEPSRQPPVEPQGPGGWPPEQVPRQNVRRASAEEIYDDLKMRDEILSGSYANAVMIGHGPHEFSFDFITNFYPHSAVSSRVFLAAGQVARLAESLRGAWEQIRHRFQPPPSSGDGSTGL